MDGTQLYRKRFWVLIIVIAAMAASLIIFAILSARNSSANLEVFAAPKGASVIIDGKQYKAGKIKLKPGTYAVRVEKEGFEAITQEVAVGTTLKQITYALTPKTDEARALADEDRKLYDQVESIGGQLAQQQGEAFTAANPLVSKLPKKTSIYAINYTKDVERPGQIYIRIDSISPAGRQAAIAQIREWGFNPTDYRIVFAGLINPFDPAASDVDQGGL